MKNKFRHENSYFSSRFFPDKVQYGLGDSISGRIYLEVSVLQPAGKQQSNVKKSKILQILTLGNVNVRRRLHNRYLIVLLDIFDNDLLSSSLLNLSRMCMTSAEFVEITLGIEVRHDLPVVTGWLLTVFEVLQMGFGETTMF